MKKTLTLFFVLCMLSSYALAENTIITNESTTKEAQTTVSYTIDACKEYTLTIPSSVTIGETLSTTLNLSLDATKYELNPGNSQVHFYVEFKPASELTYNESDFTFNYYLMHVNGTDKIAYFIEDENQKSMCHAYRILETRYYSYDMPEEATSASLTLTAAPTGEEIPGDYTDTITFKVYLEEQR